VYTFFRKQINNTNSNTGKRTRNKYLEDYIYLLHRDRQTSK
jgi:hypothetical protein